VTRLAAVAVATLLLAACSSSDSSEVETGGTDGSEKSIGTLAQIGERLAFELTTDPDPPVAGAPVTWTFKVRNVSATPVTATFADAKQADVSLRRDEAEVYRWSEDRAFTAAIVEWTLDPDEEREIALDEEELDVEPGEYELVAELTSDQAVEPATKVVTVTATD
jgi:hypothetical protein